MSKLRLNGATSGYIELEAPAVADNGTLTLPTAAAGFGPAGIGSNVVQTVKTDTFTTTSSSFVDITGLTVTITPTSATSKILVIYSVLNSNTRSDVSAGGLFVLTDGSNNVLVQGDAASNRTRTTFSVRGNAWTATNTMAGTYLWSPSTTSAVTAKVRVALAGGGTTVINRTGFDFDDAENGRFVSTLTAIEVAA